MNKKEFIKKLDGRKPIFPETDEQIDWFNEWMNNHPEIQYENERSYRELTEKQATEYMALKIFARIFIEKNGTGIYFAKLEARKITICKHTGEIAKGSPKLEIEL